MKLGIISDTHDNLDRITQCVEVLNQQKVDFVIHCGDFVAPFAVNPFEQLDCDWLGVFGNNDGEKPGLIKKSGGRIKEPPYFLELAAKKIGVTHEPCDLEAEIILCGHTHEPEISQNSKLRINPGEVCGWLYSKPSLAVLDLNNMKPEIIYL